MNRRLLVHLDADATIGLGHAVRTANLLHYLPDLEIVVSGQGRALDEFFPTARRVTPSRNAHDLAAIATRIKASGLLLDQPHMATQIATLRPSCTCPIAVIDDYGGIPSSDLIINGTILPAYHEYSAIRHNDRILAGGAYALIHDAFACRSEEKATNSHRLLIVVGSDQRAFDWLDFLLAHFDGAAWDETTIVTGRAHPDPHRISSICSQRQIRHRHAISSEALAKETHRAKAALTTGGMIVYETLAAGLPVAAFPQINNLEAEMAHFAAQGAIIDLGHQNGFQWSVVDQALAILRHEPERRARMRQAGLNLIDGHGLRRAAKSLHELLRLNGGHA